MNGKVKRFGWRLLVFGAVVVASCSQQQADDRPRIVGLWGMGYISSNGMKASEGREWFEFREDGTLSSRSSPGYYQEGFWRLDQGNGKLTLGEPGIDSLVYDYHFQGDSLILESVMEALQHRVGICLVRIPKKPIEMAEELAIMPSSVDSAASR